jgi:hypothetical protein
VPVEIAPDYAPTAVCGMMMLNALTEIFQYIVRGVEVAPGMRLIDISSEFVPEGSSFAI